MCCVFPTLTFLSFSLIYPVEENSCVQGQDKFPFSMSPCLRISRYTNGKKEKNTTTQNTKESLW